MCSELIYRRTGGIAGTNDEITIGPDGTIESSGKLVGEASGVLSPQQVDELLILLEGWHSLSVATAKADCADAFGHSIFYDGSTLSWSDCTLAVPEQLAEIQRWVGSRQSESEERP